MIQWFHVVVGLPALLITLERIARFILDRLEQSRREKLLLELTQAINDAVSRKDTSQLEDLFDPDKKKEEVKP